MPIASYAAGLGKLTVISGLGEPLSAEVELLSTTKDELASLTAQIAPAEVFAEQGVERAAVLSSVRVEIGKRPDGMPVLRLTTSQPVNDPFLDMLIQVEWSSGRLLREYTALLDPPGFGDQSPAAPAAALPDAGTAQETPPGAASEKIARQPRSPDVDQPVAEESADRPEGHTVRKGDTLHAIARENMIEGVSLEQMLIGLYRANRQAFAGNNMNRLKVGQIVHVPPAEELQAVTQGEAAKEIRVQTANWNAYRDRLAGMVAESAPAVEEPTPQSASGKISAPAEDKSAVPAQGPRDVVKLSKSETGAVAKGGSADAARIAALQEEATARENAVKEAQARVGSLEKQLQDMQKLLEIKNKALADAQSVAQAQPTPQPAPPVAQPAVPPAQSAVPAAQPEPQAAAPVQPEPAPEAKPKKLKRPLPPPPAEPGLMDVLTENPLLLAAGGGGLLALLGGAWLFMRNKRKKGLDSFEQGILTTGGLKPNTVFGNTAGGTVDTGNTSFLTDFGQGATTGMIDTSDVDPIAEAEVYMAYGRDVQAEEILKDAISKEPKRHELHLKLLEIYANRKDTAAFETLAAELYAALGASHPIWARVAELGHRVEPGNPLYSSGAAQAKAESGAQDFDATMIQSAPMAQQAPDDLDLTLGTEEATLDFSLDEAAPEAAAAEAEESNTLDFDLGGIEAPAAEEPVAEAPSAELDVADLELPSELPALETSSAFETPEAEQAEPAPEESAGLDFDFSLPEPAADETAQLDVADLGTTEIELTELGADTLPELPQAEAAPAAAAEEPASLDLPELDMGEIEAAPEAQVAEAPATELTLPELELPTETPSAAAAEEPQTEDASDLGFDLSSLDMPEESPAEAESELPELSMPEAAAAAEPEQAPSLDMDLGDFMESPAAEAPATVTEEEAPAAFPDLTEPAQPDEALETAAAAEPEVQEAAGLDFDFDIDLGAPTQEAPAKAAEASALPDLDLSGISLDVGEPAATEATADQEITLSAAESPDVDTKLDLVTAYIDMGDQEGARELLQEVLKEGGPTQREKAQKLLDGIA